MSKKRQWEVRVRVISYEGFYVEAESAAEAARMCEDGDYGEADWDNIESARPLRPRLRKSRFG